MDNKQITLKPQDLVVLLKLAGATSDFQNYADFAKQLGLTASQVHASVSRARLARLVTGVRGEKPTPVKAALREFILFGAKYAFPAVFGAATRGIETSYAAAPLSSIITHSNDLPPVWPDPHGSVRGLAFYPLYPNAIVAARQDNSLYELLALFDALRGGAAREREIAIELLQKRLL